MVAQCRRKGLEAYVMDFLSLDFAEPFPAVFAMNCFLHVPKPDFRASLEAIRGVPEPGGLFYLGQYGGMDFEGIAPEDIYEAKRFFSYFTHEGILGAVKPVFEVRDFRSFKLRGSRTGTFFQAAILRAP